MKQTLLTGLVAFMSASTLAAEVPKDAEMPVVKTFGVNLSTYNPIPSNTDVAVDGRASFDIGAGYELPVYTMDQFYIARQRVKLFLGGRNTLQLTAYLLRFNFYLDIWPFKYTLENYFSYDLLGDGGICWAGFSYTDITRIQLYMQVDYQDCAVGILGSTLLDTYTNCEW